MGATQTSKQTLNPGLVMAEMAAWSNTECVWVNTCSATASKLWVAGETGLQHSGDRVTAEGSFAFTTVVCVEGAEEAAMHWLQATCNTVAHQSITWHSIHIPPHPGSGT